MKKLWIIGIILLILAGLAVAFVTFVCEDDWCYVFPWQKATVMVPDDWKEFSSNTVGFSIQYDPSLTLGENSATDVQFYKWGPTQSGQTEIYDGMILAVRRFDITGSLEIYINTQLEQIKNVGTVTVPPHNTKLGGRTAIEFNISALGDFTVIMVPINNQTIVEVSYMAPDPTNAGFQNTIDIMLSTFKLIP